MKISRSQLRKIIWESVGMGKVTSKDLRDRRGFDYHETLPGDVIALLAPHLDSGMMSGPTSKVQAISIIDKLLKTGQYTTSRGDRKALQKNELFALQNVRKQLTGSDLDMYGQEPAPMGITDDINMEKLQARYRRQLADFQQALNDPDLPKETVMNYKQAMQYTVNDILAAGGKPGVN